MFPNRWRNDTEKARYLANVPHQHVGTMFDCVYCTIMYLCDQLDGERAKHNG